MFAETAGAGPTATGTEIDIHPDGPRRRARPGGSLLVYWPDGVTPIPAFTGWRSSRAPVLA